MADIIESLFGGEKRHRAEDDLSPTGTNSTGAGDNRSDEGLVTPGALTSDGVTPSLKRFRVDESVAASSVPSTEAAAPVAGDSDDLLAYLFGETPSVQVVQPTLAEQNSAGSGNSMNMMNMNVSMNGAQPAPPQQLYTYHAPSATGGSQQVVMEVGEAGATPDERLSRAKYNYEQLLVNPSQPIRLLVHSSYDSIGPNMHKQWFLVFLAYVPQKMVG